MDIAKDQLQIFKKAYSLWYLPDWMWSSSVWKSMGIVMTWKYVASTISRYVSRASEIYYIPSGSKFFISLLRRVIKDDNSNLTNWCPLFMRRRLGRINQCVKSFTFLLSKFSQPLFNIHFPTRTRQTFPFLLFIVFVSSSRSSCTITGNLSLHILEKGIENQDCFDFDWNWMKKLNAVVQM